MDAEEVAKKVGRIKIFGQTYLDDGFAQVLYFYDGSGGKQKKYSVLAKRAFGYQEWTRPPSAIHLDGDWNFVLGDESYDLATLGFMIDYVPVSVMTQMQRVKEEHVPDVQERLDGIDYRHFLTMLWMSCCAKSGIWEMRIPPAERFAKFPPTGMRTELGSVLPDKDVRAYYEKWRRSRDPGASHGQINNEVRSIQSQRKGWRRNYNDNALEHGFRPKAAEDGTIEYFYLEL